jgi:hypothetical protein
VSTDLERDLGAWTAGELTRERLLATHGAAAAGTVALHDRLTEAARSTTVPNAEAGWAALLVAMDAPAPVVPLRRHVPRRRTVALLAAATLVLAGTAFAAKLSLGHRVAPIPATGTSMVGPAGGSASSVGTNDRRLVPPPAGSAPSAPHPHDGSPSASANETGTGDRTSSGDGGAPTSTDDPHDRDRGTGNDGSHDDQGGGNDGSSGSLPGGSNGHGH